MQPARPTPPTRRQHRFLQRSVRHAEALLAELGDPGPTRRGLDPRVTLITALAVLVVLALLRQPWLLTLAAATAVATCLALGLARPLATITVPVLLFTAVLLVPATMSVVRPGPIVVPLWSGAGFTSTGLRNAWIVLARVLASLAVVVLLTRTTSWLRLMASLRAVGAPAGFVTIATMAHRYLAVLLRSFTDSLLARRARSLGRATGRDDRAFVGGTVGALFLRSSDLAEQVHRAMAARGFTGRLIDPEPQRLRSSDVVIGIGIIAAAAALLAGDLLVR